MESIKLALLALQAAQRDAEQGWIWFFDQDIGTICAKRGNAVRKVFALHPTSVDEQGHPTQLAQRDTSLVIQALNEMPKLLAALERAIEFAEGLDEMAEMRERAAHSARRDERYDLSEVHRQSAKRVRNAQRAFLEKVGEAFSQPLPPRI